MLLLLSTTIFSFWVTFIFLFLSQNEFAGVLRGSVISFYLRIGVIIFTKIASWLYQPKKFLLSSEIKCLNPLDSSLLQIKLNENLASENEDDWIYDWDEGKIDINQIAIQAIQYCNNKRIISGIELGVSIVLTKPTNEIQKQKGKKSIKIEFCISLKELVLTVQSFSNIRWDVLKSAFYRKVQSIKKSAGNPNEDFKKIFLSMDILHQVELHGLSVSSQSSCQDILGNKTQELSASFCVGSAGSILPHKSLSRKQSKIHEFIASIQDLSVGMKLVDKSTSIVNFEKVFYTLDENENYKEMEKVDFTYDVKVSTKIVSLSLLVTKEGTDITLTLEPIILSMKLYPGNEMKGIYGQPRFCYIACLEKLKCVAKLPNPSDDQFIQQINEISISFQSFAIAEAKPRKLEQSFESINVRDIADALIHRSSKVKDTFSAEHFHIMKESMFITILFHIHSFQVLSSLFKSPIESNDENVPCGSMILKNKILIKNSSSHLQMHWSILNHLLIFTFIHSIGAGIKVVINFVKPKNRDVHTRRKILEKTLTEIQCDCEILLNILLGRNKGSNLDITGKGLQISIEDDNFDSQKKKPSLLEIKCDYAEIYTKGSLEPSGKLDFVRFTTVYRNANEDEVSKYETISKSATSQNLVVNEKGAPFMECISFDCRRAIIEIRPNPPFGEILENFISTQPLLKSTLRKMNCMKKKENSNFQLMKISVNIDHIDASILENRSLSQSEARDAGVPPTSYDEQVERHHLRNIKRQHTIDENANSYLHRLRILLSNVAVSIRRNAPRTYFDQRLKELDEHPEDEKFSDKNYGPEVLGGEYCTVALDRIIVIIDPLNLVVPFLDVSSICYEGLLLIAPLISKCSRSPLNLKIRFPLVSCLELERRSIDRRPIQFLSYFNPSGIPPKVYLDGVFTIKNTRIAFGQQVQVVMPKLLEIFQLSLPPPPFGESPVKLGWWDNLRFWIHGKFLVQIEKFRFDWLLDSVDKFNWSIQATCTKFNLEYSTGKFISNLHNLVLSVPSRTYESAVLRSRTKSSFKEDEDERDSNDRFSMLFVPHLQLNCNVKWTTSSRRISALAHHSPYFHHPYEQSQALDFSGFISAGIHMDLDLQILGHADYANWVTVRNDNLPWLTHQPSCSLPEVEEEEDDPGPFPQILSLSCKGMARDVRIGLWKTDPVHDENGLCVTLSSIVVDSSSSVSSATLLDTNDTNDNDEVIKNTSTLTLVSSSTVVELSSAYAALLDVTKPVQKKENNEKAKDYSSFLKEAAVSDILDESSIIHDPNQVFDFDHTDEKKDIDWYDRVAGLLGAQEKELLDQLGGSEYKKEDSKAITERENGEKSPKASERDDGHLNIFKLIQLAEISDLDYLVEISNVIIIDRSLDDIISDGQANNDSQISNYEVPWTFFLSGMKLLWTLEIRNVLILLIGDLTQTINFMNLQIKDSISVTETDADAKENELVSFSIKSIDENISANGNDPASTKGATNLEYLLQNKESVGMSYATDEKREIKAPIKDGEEPSQTIRQDKLQSFPRFNVHLSNPQIQLHSQATGGSIVFAIHGAYVEGRKAKKLIRTLGDSLGTPEIVSINNFLRRTDAEYTLERVEAYAVDKNVDVDLGLQWLKTDISEVELSKIERPKNSEKNCDENFFGNFTPAYFQTLVATREFIIPRLFKKLLDPCTFRVRQIFHRTPTDLSNEEMRNIIEIHEYNTYEYDLKKLVMDQLEVSIDELSFTLNSNQFSTTIDLSRNLFLAPVPVASQTFSSFNTELNQHEVVENLSQISLPLLEDKQENSINDQLDAGNKKNDDIWSKFRRKRKDVMDKFGASDNQTFSATNDSSLVSSIDDQFSSQQNSDKSISSPKFNTVENLRNTGRSINKKRNRTDLKQAATELVNALEKEQALSGGSRTIRRVHWRLGKAKWSISSEEHLDDVRIDLTEISGHHEFTQDAGLSSTIALDNLHISTLKPGPLSMLFDDCTTVLGTELGVSEMSPCRRCGVIFDREDNQSMSCICHVDQFGEAGTFDGEWTCCGAKSLDAPGCNSRPHSAQERAVFARLEAVPTVDKITLYKHVEISIYPSVPYKLIVQITKTMADLFVTYFLGDKGSKNFAAPDKSEEKNFFQDYKNESSKTQDEDEVIFVKLWRVGEINIEVSTLGFPIVPVTDKLLLQVPSFSRAYKIGTVAYLARKYLSFLIQEVIKSATSSGIEKIKEKFFTDNKSEQTDNNEESKEIVKVKSHEEPENEEESKKTNMLLGTSTATKTKPLSLPRRNLFGKKLIKADEYQNLEESSNETKTHSHDGAAEGVSEKLLSQDDESKKLPEEKALQKESMEDTSKVKVKPLVKSQEKSQTAENCIQVVRRTSLLTVLEDEIVDDLVADSKSPVIDSKKQNEVVEEYFNPAENSALTPVLENEIMPEPEPKKIVKQADKTLSDNIPTAIPKAPNKAVKIEEATTISQKLNTDNSARDQETVIKSTKSKRNTDKSKRQSGRMRGKFLAKRMLKSNLDHIEDAIKDLDTKESPDNEDDENATAKKKNSNTGTLTAKLKENILGRKNDNAADLNGSSNEEGMKDSPSIGIDKDKDSTRDKSHGSGIFPSKRKKNRFSKRNDKSRSEDDVVDEPSKEYNPDFAENDVESSKDNNSIIFSSKLKHNIFGKIEEEPGEGEDEDEDENEGNDVAEEAGASRRNSYLKKRNLKLVKQPDEFEQDCNVESSDEIMNKKSTATSNIFASTSYSYISLDSHKGKTPVINAKKEKSNESERNEQDNNDEVDENDEDDMEFSTVGSAAMPGYVSKWQVYGSYC